MGGAEKTDKRDILPAVLMGGLFVLIHVLALVITGTFEEAEMQAFDDANDPMNIVFIVVIMLVFTLAILFIAKFWKKQLIQVIILGAIGYTSGYVFYPLFNLILTTMAAVVISVILAIFLVIVLYKYPEWYVIDMCGIIVGTGAIAIFGISLGILLVIILLIGLAIYDAISVYKTKHMIDLADTVMDLKLPVLLVIPKIRHYSLLKETKRLKEQIEKDEDRDAFFMGLGDIVMPGILVVATYASKELDPNNLLIALSVIIGTLVGFSILMIYVMRGKPQAGLPLLCGGAILGYLVSSYLLFGKLVGLNFQL